MWQTFWNRYGKHDSTFPEPIIDCSDRIKHIFNIKEFPAIHSEKLVQANGPGILIIKSKGLYTGMRFCDQTRNKNEYVANIANIVSVNLNQFSVGYPFTLAGNSYRIEGKQLQNVEFKIVDVFDNDVEFVNDLIWTISLERVE